MRTMNMTTMNLGLPKRRSLVAPGNLVAPVVTGNPEINSLLSVDNGSWSGTPSSYSYQWYWADGTPATISGATSATYRPVAADKGHTIKCQVTATNAGGSTNQDSNTTAALYNVNFKDGTVTERRTALTAMFTCTRASSIMQSNGDGTFTSIATDVMAMGPDGLQTGPGWVNPVLYSSELTTGQSWTEWGTCTRSYSASAFGDLGGTTLTADAANGNHGCYKASTSLTGGVSHCIFATVKPGGTSARYFGIRSATISTSSTWVWACFDLQAGTAQVTSLTGAEAGMFQLGTSGVYVCWMTYIANATESGSWAMALHNSATPNTGSGAPTFAGGGGTVIVGGFGYISGKRPALNPVQTAGSGVTIADVNIAATGLTVPASGTAFSFRVQAKTYTGYTYPNLGIIVTYDDNSTENNNAGALYETTGTGISAFQSTDGNSQKTVSTPSVHAVGVRIKSNDLSSSVNGAAEVQDATATYPGSATVLRIGRKRDGTLRFWGAIQSAPCPGVYRPANDNLLTMSAVV